jgi:cytochrome c-type biogenesis protein CcmE
LTTGKKLFLGSAVIATVCGYMAFVGASSSWQYYLSVDECLADAPGLVGRPIRVNGRVASEAMYLRSDGRELTFELAGNTGRLQVQCAGPLPDNFGKDKDVVVEGRLASAQLLQGKKVLTRCASKYEAKDRRGEVPGPSVPN